MRDEKTIKISSKLRLTQDEQGWWLNHKKLVSEATLRISHILFGDRTNRVFYQGVVNSRGVGYPFCLPCEQLENQPFETIRRVIATGGGEIPVFRRVLYFDPVAAALRLSDARTVHVAESVGWDPGHRRLTLPDCTISATGVVEPLPVPLATFTDVSAFAQLGPPRELTGADLADLSRGDAETALLWGTLIAVAANVVADILDQPQINTVLAGDAASRVGGAAAEALGCRALAISQHDSDAFVKTVGAALKEHAWPVLIRRVAKHILGQDGVAVAGQFRRCLIATTAGPAACAVLHGNCGVIELDAGEARTPSRNRLHTLGAALLAYLQNLLTRRAALPPGKDLRERVQEDVTTWFTSLGGRALALTKLKDAAIWPDNSPGWELGYFVANAAQADVCGMSPDPDKPRIAKITRDRLNLVRQPRRQKVFLPREIFQGFMETHRFRSLEIAEIERLFEAADVSAAPAICRSIPGWNIPEVWFDEQLVTHFARKRASERFFTQPRTKDTL